MRFPLILRENSTELKTKAIKTKGYSNSVASNNPQISEILENRSVALFPLLGDYNYSTSLS